MPCITVLVPGLREEDRTLLEEGAGFKHAIGHISDVIQTAAFESAATFADNTLTREDFWVYVIPVMKGPATKITIELLARPDRDQAWLKALATNVARATLASCEKYSDRVVVFTDEQDAKRGFCEIGGH